MLSIAIKSFFKKGIKLLLTPREFVKYLMPFVSSVANNIGFDDTKPSDYYTDEGFSAIITWHSNHPGIIKIMENKVHNSIFQFQCINQVDVVNIINCFDS